MEEPKAAVPNGHSDSHTEDKPEQMEVDEVETKMKEDAKTAPKRTKSTDSDEATNSSPKAKTQESEKTVHQSFENALMQIEKSSIKKKLPQKIVKRSPRISRNKEPPEKDGETSKTEEKEDEKKTESPEKEATVEGEAKKENEVKKEVEGSKEVAATTNKEKKESVVTKEVEKKESKSTRKAVQFTGDPDADFLGFDDPKTSNYTSSRDKFQKMIDELVANSSPVVVASTSGISSRSRRSTTVKRDSAKEVESQQPKAGTSESVAEKHGTEPETEAGDDENKTRRSRPSQVAQSERKSSSPSVKRNFDVSLPQYLKPFEYGWKRELAYRNNTENFSKRMADVFYYTPLGKKIRSIGAVKDYLLGTDLTLDNFTFVTKAMNLNDPNKETIRDARKNIVNKPVTPTQPPLTTRKSAALSRTNSAESAGDNAEETPKASPLSTPKISLKSFRPPQKNKANKTPVPEKKSKKSSDDSDNDKDELEMGMLPPMWDESLRPDWSANGSTTMNKKSEKSGNKRPLETDKPEPEAVVSPPAKRSKKEPEATASDAPDAPKADSATSNAPVDSVATVADPVPEKVPAVPASSSVSVNKDYFMFNVGAIYHALLNSFQYLKVQELLRAARVCHMWRDVAMNRSLWHIVRMKNSRVRDWDGLANTLRQSGTRHLDLRKMLMPDKSEEVSEMWTRYAAAIDRVNSLWRVDLCRCPATAVESSARASPRLQYLAALAIKSNSLDASAFENCRNMIELRLKSSEKNGLDLENLSALKHLTKMKHLSLTTLKSFSADLAEVLENMKDLETLELGECSELNESVATKALPKLKRLQRLRLEKGQGDSCPTLAILNSVKDLKNLVQLELINFDIKSGFDTTIAKCAHLKTLLIIPTYVTQSATTNHLVMEGVGKLSKTLTLFVWGITLELLRVTDLFIDQWEGQKGAVKSTNAKKGSGDSIPILKPISETGNKEAGAPSQVDILQLPKLHKVLTTLLPSTKVKILKVPFSATWRQTVAGPAHIH